MATTNLPLITIIGPTASGKSALALELAETYGGEIICADSRTVYKGMDVGTAKPTLAERRRIPHHLLDIVAPNEPFSVADFQRLAKQAITDIRKRGNIPFLVGGSGLYIDSVIFDYKFTTPPANRLREQLQNMSILSLQELCIENNIELPENKNNKRYLIRAIEQKGVNRERRNRLIAHTLVVGLSTKKHVLAERIRQRANQLFEQNVVEEAIYIERKYPEMYESKTGNIYRLAKDLQQGCISYDEAREKFIALDRRLAKKQMTWFQRNPFIHWGNADELKNLVSAYITSYKRDIIEGRGEKETYD